MLLALMHHSNQSTVLTFCQFRRLFTPILTVQLAQLHQYTGARDMVAHILYISGTLIVAPVGEETLISCIF
jgi:hypothetical protein